MSNPKRWCYENAALNMPANLENSAVVTGLEKVSFHSSPKERQCPRMLKLPHNCTHLTREQSNAQNSPSQASTACELWTSRCSSWIYKMQRNQRASCQHPLDHQKSKRIPEKYLLLLYWLSQSLWLCGSQQTGKFFKRWEYQTTWPASWEIWIQVKKQELELDMGQQTGSKLGEEYIKAVSLPCLFNLYAEYIMQNVGLDKAQARIKIAGRNINNL